MRDLRPLHLPRLVEARRKRDSSSSELDLQDGSASGRCISNSNSNISPLLLSHSSASSDCPQSPLTSVFSSRGHSRISSCNSSLASSPTMGDSLDAYMGKRPLTEVKEEPQQEKDDDDMLDITNRKLHDVDHEINASGFGLRDSFQGADYEWVDSPGLDDFEFEYAAAKRRRAEPPSPSGMTARLRTRFPVLSRQWKSRGGERRKSSLSESFQESIVSRSRASSLRAPSVLEGRTDIPMPPTPSESFIVETPEQLANSTGNVSQDIVDPEAEPPVEDDEVEPEETLSRTPLLPPVMTSLQSVPQDEPVQSPLQSPKIVETPTSPQSPALNSCRFPTPAVTTTATTIGLPSPPLSSRPSMSSVHRSVHQIQHPLSTAPVTAAADIPPMLLSPAAAPQDEWADRLGHANFTIYPEPYELPAPTAIGEVQRLRQDWEVARHAYSRHLGRAAECYSTTSRTYALTEQKWATVDAAWRAAHDRAIATLASPALTIAEAEAEAEARTRPTEITSAISASAIDPGTTTPAADAPAPPIRMPPLNGPQCAGKFPAIGDRGIVGPMTRAPPPASPTRPSRKRAFWKFLQGMFPVGGSGIVAARSY